MSGSIRVSEKHGVNPSIEKCFFCGKDKGLILFGRLPEDEEATREVCLNHEPCDKCKEYMKQGIILVSIRDGEPQSNNPYRTGRWFVVKEEAVRRMPICKETIDNFCKRRFGFIADKALDMLGFPKKEE